MHYAQSGQGSLDENLCVYSQVGSVSHTTLRDWTSVLTSGNSVIWDLLGPGLGQYSGPELDIWRATFYDCEYYAPSYSSAYGRFRVFVYLKPDPISNAPCSGTYTISCVNFGLARYDGLGNILDYYDGYMYINIASWGTTAGRNATFNHEFGHVVGLLDPNYGDCGGSVMHQFGWYGCSGTIQFPTTSDRSSVQTYMMPFPHD